VEVKEFAGFLAMFLILFVTTGVGNGSTYRMIPSIFREETSQGKGQAKGRPRRRRASGKHSERRRARSSSRDRRVRRLPDPKRLRQIDRATGSRSSPAWSTPGSRDLASRSTGSITSAGAPKPGSEPR